MSRTLAKLVYMANQIAREFSAQQPDRAAEATFDHLWHFWDPRMRALIVAHLRDANDDLSDIARAAVERLAQGAEPDPQTKATEFSKAADPDLMSDGG